MSFKREGFRRILSESLVKTFEPQKDSKEAANFCRNSMKNKLSNKLQKADKNVLVIQAGKAFEKVFNVVHCIKCDNG